VIATAPKEKIMTLKLSSAIGMALMLAACAGGTKNRGLESVHQPVVQRTDYVIDVATSGYGGSLAPGERERLDGWFNSIGLAFGDRVAVDDPSGAAGGRDDVVSLLSGRGMMVSKMAPTTAGTVAPGTVRVVVSRASAGVPGCPDWSRSSDPDYGNNTMSNYGCATNSALAAMVADPQDLIQGREVGGPADSVSSSKAIQLYRRTAPTGALGLKSETTKGSK
jgi:pilus assembly protein CpaD